MGKGINKFLNLIGFGDDEDSSAPESYPASGVGSSRESASGRMTSGTAASAGPRKAATQVRSAPPSSGRIVNMQQAGTQDPMRMMLLQPQSFEDTQMVIDNLREGKSVIVNLENMNQDAAQRVLDFISGAIYALDGDMRKVSKGIFLCAPHGIDISGNVASSFASSLRRPDRR